MLSNVARDLLQAVENASERLRRISDVQAALKPAPEKWSKKEILGHLVDSAANNHQRFVRAWECEDLALPAYAQDAWVSCQGYNEADWLELVEFWRLYNRRLARIIERLPEKKQSVVCRIGSKEPLTLGQVVESYLAHLQHHVAQLLAG